MKQQTEVEARSLADVREDIDELDQTLVRLIGDRMALAREASAWKQVRGLPSTDLSREAAVVRAAADSARDLGLEPEIVREIFWKLLHLSQWARTTDGLALVRP